MKTSAAAAVLGRRGGQAKTDAKAKAARENGRLSTGRPPTQPEAFRHSETDAQAFVVYSKGNYWVVLDEATRKSFNSRRRAREYLLAAGYVVDVAP